MPINVGEKGKSDLACKALGCKEHGYFVAFLEEDARTAFSHQELIRKAFCISFDGTVASGWNDRMSYG